ncbi:MAG: hypothetical protein QNJ70_08910 [Xenococcaceae cyanobacterium MO_207.B15]|nr:hypothetical protein [Xenococcaceae cyanobacterium MO_207.B15]
MRLSLSHPFFEFHEIILKKYLNSFIKTFVVSSQAQAATLTSREQVNRVVEWFTGLFDNTEQVSTILL